MNQNCPDCGSLLGKGAYKCRCGWKGAGVSETVPTQPCAHLGCANAAIACVKTPTGRANLCKPHYLTHWTVDVLKALPTGKPSTLYMEQVRAAYLRSQAYREVSGDERKAA